LTKTIVPNTQADPSSECGESSGGALASISPQEAGRIQARAKNVRFGRHPREIPYDRIEDLYLKGLSLAAIARVLDIPYKTLYQKFRAAETYCAVQSARKKFNNP